MTWHYRIDDRTRFFRVLRRFLKYIFVPAALATLLLSVFLSYVAVEHNSGGYYCNYYDQDGFFYRERQDCSVETERVFVFFIGTAGAVFLLSGTFLAVLGIGVYLRYLVVAPERLGLEKQIDGA